MAARVEVRGVLGNKCAGQHNLNTFILKRQLFKVIFCHGHQQYVFFFCRVCLPQDGGGKLACSDGGGDPLHTLLKGALGQQCRDLKEYQSWSPLGPLKQIEIRYFLISKIIK